MNVFFHNNVSDYKNISCIKEDLTSLHDKKVDLPGKAEMSAHAVQTKYKSCTCIQVFCNEEMTENVPAYFSVFVIRSTIVLSMFRSLSMPYHPTPPPLCSATHVAPRKASPIQFCTAMSENKLSSRC